MRELDTSLCYVNVVTVCVLR